MYSADGTDVEVLGTTSFTLGELWESKTTEGWCKLFDEQKGYFMNMLLVKRGAPATSAATAGAVEEDMCVYYLLICAMVRGMRVLSSHLCDGARHACIIFSSVRWCADHRMLLMCHVNTNAFPYPCIPTHARM
jgi:hypothetical protein